MSDRARTPAGEIRERQGRKIRQFREVQSPRMTQGDLAELVGVTKAAVSDWERGISSPRQHHQVAVARALKAPWSVLFGLDGEVA